MNKPILTIDDFGGMGNKNVYYLDGRAPTNMSGQNILTAKYTTENAISDEYDNFNGCCDMVRIDHENDGQCIAWNGNKVYSYDLTITSRDIGLIHSLDVSGTLLSGDDNKSGIMKTEDEHVLYASRNHLGIGYKGQCTADGTTTTLVDTSVDFTALTTADTATTMKVYNFSTKEEYTVSSVTATEITFTTAAATAPSANDYYMLFVDGKWGFDTATGSQFEGQIPAGNWYKRIILWEDSFYVTNGNYIARLSSDLGTWDAKHKQLPARAQALEISYNSSKILISCDIDDKGTLILWDGKETGGFLNKLELSSSTTSLTQHGSGFVFNVADKLYYTDGYSYNDFATVPNIRPERRNVAIEVLNNIKSAFGNIYMLTSTSHASHGIKGGVLIYDKKYGFTQIPLKKGDGSSCYYAVGGGLFFFREYGVNKNLVSFEDGTSSSAYQYNISEIYSSPADKNAVIFNIRLPRKTKVSIIELSVGQIFNNYGFSSAGAYTDVTVSSCDGRYTFWKKGQVASSPTPTKTAIGNTVGAYSFTKVGDEILLLEGDAGGEKTFVSSITNAGTSSEVITVSPAFSTAPSANSNFNILPLKTCGTRRVMADDNSKTLVFNAQGTGLVDYLYIEVAFNGVLDLDILSLNIY